MSDLEELRKGISEELSIIKKDIEIDVGSAAYPSIMFRFLIDSKADIDLEAKELIAYVHIASRESPAISKITWSRIEESLLVNSVSDIKAKGSGWVTIHFTPPFSVFKSEFAHQWTLEGILVFSSRVGDIIKNFNIDFGIKKEYIKTVLEKYHNLS
jgi:hypothetical protein